MTRHHMWGVTIAVALMGGPSAFAQPAQVAAPAQLSDTEQEAFLRNAEIVSRDRVGTGVTLTYRVVLSDETMTHDAHVQNVDIYRTIFETPQVTELNFRDTYRYNIAAYRLARVLGMSNIPVAVERAFDGGAAAFSWWVDDVQMDERGRREEGLSPSDSQAYATQVQMMYVFDELIQNSDRNLGNMLWTSDWHLWLIDHSRAFRLGKELRFPTQLQRCERTFFEALKDLTEERLEEAVGPSLNELERDAVLARRDLLIAHFETMIGARGESAVLIEPRQE